MMYCRLICFAIVLCAHYSEPAAIPIWDRLTRQEKVTALTYKFMRLVGVYCANSKIPDCENILSLYGVSNLLKKDTYTLDVLEPYQRGIDSLLWETLMGPKFEKPKFSAIDDIKYFIPMPISVDNRIESSSDTNTIGYVGADYTGLNQMNIFNNNQIEDFNADYPIYGDYAQYDENVRHPYAVSVAAPPHILSNVKEQEINKNNIYTTTDNFSNRRQIKQEINSSENEIDSLDYYAKKVNSVHEKLKNSKTKNINKTKLIILRK